MAPDASAGTRTAVSTRPLRLFPWILLAAAGLRALAWERALMMTSDGPDFLWQAQRMLAGDFSSALAHHYHPLYAALAAGASLLVGDLVAGAVIVSIAAGVAAVAAVYALARRALPDRPEIALAAALLAAVHAGSITHSSDVRNDGLHAALFVVSIAALAGALERGGWRWAAAGATAGLAYLTRPESLFLVVPALLAVAACGRRRGAAAAARGALGFSLALALLAAPYLLSIHGQTGRWQVSMKPSVANVGLAKAPHLPAGSPLASPTVADRGAADTDADLRDATPEGLDEDLRQVGKAFLDVTREDVLLLAALGLAPFLRRRGLLLAGLVVVAGWIAMLTLHHSTSGYLNDRHLLPPALLVLPLAGAGWLWLWNARGGKPAVRLVCVLMIALFCVGGVKRRHGNEAPLLGALAFAREHTSADQRLVVMRRKEGWYADRPVVLLRLPCADADLVATMKRQDAPLLVLDEHAVRAAAPHWLDGPLFQLLARFHEGDEAVVVLALRG